MADAGEAGPTQAWRLAALTGTDSTQRFSECVADYEKYRPGYPEALLDHLKNEGVFFPGCRIADIGSGTGIFSALLLGRGYQVVGVEPNAPMRQAAERRLGTTGSFTSVDGAAEATTLPEASVDAVTAAQAFHWFDPSKARAEFARILRPAGRAALIWNRRAIEATGFLRVYEALLKRWGIDYAHIRYDNLDLGAVASFFPAHQSASFANEQILDLDGLLGRVRSCSYAPPAGHANHAPLYQGLEEAFASFQENGAVRLFYQTEIYFGSVRKS